MRQARLRWPRGSNMLLAAAAALAVTVAAAPTSAIGATSPRAGADTALRFLTADLRDLSQQEVDKDTRAALLRATSRARRTSRTKPCKAVRAMNRFRKLAGDVKGGRGRTRQPEPGSPRGLIEADALAVLAALRGLPGSRSCGGVADPPSEAMHEVLASSARQLRVRVRLPVPTFTPHRFRTTDYVQMHMEGMGFGGGEIGEPGLPLINGFFAIPENARVQLRIDETDGYVLDGVKLFPLQEDPVDGVEQPPESTFLDPAFQIDSKAFRSRAPFPRKVAHGSALGNLRDLRVGGFDTSGGQYRARSGDLRVLTSIVVTITFAGEDNQGRFGRSDVGGVWDRGFAETYDHLINFETARAGLTGARRIFCGEEMLVITSAELRPAANTFAASRSAAGIVTSVREVGTGPGQIGTLNTDIQSFIRSRLTASCLVRPTWVVLLGNTAHVPTFLVPCGPDGDIAECDIASDLPYSLDGVGTDIFADVELGRISAPDLDTANTVVNKIIGYETSMPAPAGDQFYSRAAITSYFQPPKMCVLNEGETPPANCKDSEGTVNGHYEIDYSNHQDSRGYTKTSETVRAAMAKLGYLVDRFYTTDDAMVMPERFNDGTAMPPEMLRPTFGWDDTGAELEAAWSEGRFIVFHRDHAGHGGWSHPSFGSGSTTPPSTAGGQADLTNGTKLPVIFGINCSSGQFDIPGNPSFIERTLQHPGGGAVGAFGATRVSPTNPNNHLAKGFFDALFPNVVPSYGSSTPTRRMGDVLTQGKLYVASVSNETATYKENHLFHYYGDPSMQIWISEPEAIDVSKLLATYVEKVGPIPPGDPPFTVQVSLEGTAIDGAFVTLRGAGEVIGRAQIHDGKATITPEVGGDAADLTVSVDHDGYLPAEEPVEDQPQQRKPSTLSQTCPQDGTAGQAFHVDGNLGGPGAGATVKLTYTRPGGTALEQSVQTAADGSWSDTLQTSGRERGTWTVQASFAGNDQFEPSTATACQFRAL